MGRIAGNMLVVALLSASLASAQSVPLQLAHAGRLLGAGDAPLDTPAQLLSFRILDRETSHPAEQTAWSGACTVRVTQGHYAVTLGDGTCGTDLTSAMLPTGASRFLEVSVGGIALSPRLRLGTVPNAAYAADAGAVGGQSLAALDQRFIRAQLGVPAAQPGSVAVAGSVQASSFVGSGAGLTSLDASQITAGTVADERLPANLARLTAGKLPSSTLPAIPDGILSANVPLLTSGRLAESVLPTGVLFSSGPQVIGGAKTFSALTTFSAGIDLLGGELSGARLQNASSPPVACTAAAGGRLYYDTTLQSVRVCQGSAWTSLLGGGGSSAGVVDLGAGSEVKLGAGGKLTIGGVSLDETLLTKLRDMGVSVGVSQADARGSCAAIKAANALAQNGFYWIDPNGGSTSDAFQVYCDLTAVDGPWTLVARIKMADGQAHWNNSAVGGTPEYKGSSTRKLSDSTINLIRSNSTYSGSTQYKFTCFEDNTSSCSQQVMYCSRSCSFDATGSVNSGACALCTKTYEGSFTQLAPNTGTRGMGHHHQDSNWFSWQRHPEQGSNSGCRSDACGGGDGHLWIK